MANQQKQSLRNATGSMSQYMVRKKKGRKSIGQRLYDAIGARMIGRSKVTGRYE